MRDAYYESDIVVLPSWREGLSRSLIEASSMECSIITTDVPGCRDIITNGINGVIVKHKNIYELKNAIKNMLFSENKISLYGKNARLKALKRYDYKYINKQIIDLFE